MNRRRLLLFALVAILSVLPGQAMAVSVPVIEGDVDATELCFQFLCGVAIFGGEFDGEVNFRNADGWVLTAIDHDPLPAPGEDANINSGVFTIKAGWRLFKGIVLGPGFSFIHNNGDNTFGVCGVLQLTQGGIGTLYFKGVLYHTVFPPALEGTVFQQPVCP